MTAGALRPVPGRAEGDAAPEDRLLRGGDRQAALQVGEEPEADRRQPAGRHQAGQAAAGAEGGAEPGAGERDPGGRATEPLRSQLAVLAFTGMRAGELQRLRPEDVDLVGGWVHIRSRPGAETKTRESRKVPIHPRLRAVLEALPPDPPAVAVHGGAEQEVPGRRPPHQREAAERAVHAAGRPARRCPSGRDAGFVVHSLRHFFETFTVNAGIPQRVIDTWLGHRSDKSMAAVYYRLTRRGLAVVHGESPVRDGRAGGRRRQGGSVMNGLVIGLVSAGRSRLLPGADPGQNRDKRVPIGRGRVRKRLKKQEPADAGSFLAEREGFEPSNGFPR